MSYQTLITGTVNQNILYLVSSLTVTKNDVRLQAKMFNLGMMMMIIIVINIFKWPT